MKVVRLSTLCTSRLYPQETFLVLISVTGWVNPRDIARPGRIISMKNSSDTIGNRTRNLPTCSAVPQPTALPHTLQACMYSHLIHNFGFWSQYIWQKTGAFLKKRNITICIPSYAILKFSQKYLSLWPLAFVCPSLIPSSCVGLRNSRWNIWVKHATKGNLLGKNLILALLCSLISLRQHGDLTKPRNMINYSKVASNVCVATCCGKTGDVKTKLCNPFET